MVPFGQYRNIHKTQDEEKLETTGARLN